jgi:methionyl-tRNA formyltransferase
MTDQTHAAPPIRKARLVFMGSPDFSVPSLRALHENFDVCAVYTQPPRKAGRGMKLQQTAVASCAESLGLPCFSPLRLRGNTEEEDRLASFDADIFVVIAYGLILPKSVLETPPLGCINGHASLLPRWRGAAPIQRAIEAGDSATGVTIMQMEEGLDTGPMLSHSRVEISQGMTAGQLHDVLSDLTADLMIPAIKGMMAGQITPAPQPEAGVTYAHKITNSETRLSFDLSAAELAQKICAFSPFPSASAQTISGRIKLVSARHLTDQQTQERPGTFLGRSTADGIKIACGENTVLEVSKLQPAGKQAMSGGAFLNGHNWQAGTRISDIAEGKDI